MKKIILSALIMGGICSANAQELRSKRGEYILPEAGDWSIGISANPFLEYFGNFFGKQDKNAAPAWNFLTRNQTITTKKLMTPTLAYRSTLRLGIGVNTEDRNVNQRNQTSAPVFPALPGTVENSYKQTTANVGIAVGVEKRRGFTRLQGIYGAEIGLNVSTNKSTYKYGNALTATTAGFPVGVSLDDRLGDGSNITTDTYGNPARITSRNNGTNVEFGIRTFIGAEYFVLPKISVGGEFGWGLGISRTGSRHVNLESVGLANGVSVVGAQKIEEGDSLRFAIDTDNNNSILGPSGLLRINLYF